MKKTTKTAPLDEDAHKYLKRLQLILYDKYGIDIQIKDLITLIINDENIKNAENFAKKIVEKEKGNNVFIADTDVNVLKLVE